MTSSPSLSWRSLSAGQLAWAAVGLVAMAVLHMWGSGETLAWVSQHPQWLGLTLAWSTVSNVAVTGILIIALVAAALRCEVHNDLRFLSVLAGSALALLLLLGTPNQRFDRVAHSALSALQADLSPSDADRNQVFQAVHEQDLPRLHTLMHAHAVALQPRP